ncbi:ubiquitin-protein ligase E3C [Tachypleus tridentatus]|uniref:ubiquitin-protein ligase E3C n=1 Tax=Tachypleus tridentatus TaxID=6853 RepID=UPI003FD1038B
MYSFEGDFRRRPQVSLGGASKKVPRDELLQRAAVERHQRELSRLRWQSAITIQAAVRGHLAREKEKAIQRKEFDGIYKLCGQQSSELQTSHMVRTLIHRIGFFYSESEDASRLAWLGQICLRKSTILFQTFVSQPELWLTVIQKLLKLNLSHLATVVTSSASIAVPLRLLEVFTDPEVYMHTSEGTTHTALLPLEKLWLHLTREGYFKKLRIVMENRVPSFLEQSASPPIPLAASLLSLIIRPLMVCKNLRSKDYVVCKLLEDFFTTPFTPQVELFLLPALAQHMDILAADMLISALLNTEGHNKGMCLSLEPTPWLLYSILYLMSSQTASLSSSVVVCYLAVLQHLITALPPFLGSVVEISSDERDSLEDFVMEDVQNQDSEKLKKIAEDSIAMLNQPEHVQVLIHDAELQSCTQEFLVPLCRVCHVLLSSHKLAIHKFRLLYTLAFNPGFLRHLWESVVTSSVPSVFDSPTPILQLLSRGLALSQPYMEIFLPQLTVFCALFSHLMPTLHEVEFYEDEIDGSSVTRMPFSLSELVSLSLALRDVCLGLIELAYPDTKPSVNEQYKHVVQSVSEECSVNTHLLVKAWLHLCKEAVGLLHQLYNRDSQRQFCPQNHWIAKHISIPVNRPTDLQFGSRRSRIYTPFVGLGALTREQLEEEGPPMSTTEIRHMTILRELPFVVPFTDRVKIFQSLVLKDKVDNQGEMSNFLMGSSIQVLIRRNYIYEDAFDKFSPENEPNLKPRMRVQVVNQAGVDEAGVDGGGIFREFLNELLKTAFDPNRGFFKTTHDRLLYPNPGVHLLVENFTKHYYFIGRMLGKAMYENMLVELPFAAFFLAKILGKETADVDIHHLASLDPIMYRNLLYLKTYDGDVSDLGLDFTVLNSELGENQVIELISEGRNTPVTESNRIRYIHLMADYKLNRQIRPQCAAFKQGLANVINLEWLRMFDPKELQILISGANVPIDLIDLRNNTNYSGGYTADHPVIQMFWKVAEEFDEKERRQLLKFVTSCSRPPLLGFKELSPSFCIQNAGSELDRLPTASTCMNLLKLPEFKDMETLRMKLMYAIKSGAGFELS